MYTWTQQYSLSIEYCNNMIENLSPRLSEECIRARVKSRCGKEDESNYRYINQLPSEEAETVAAYKAYLASEDLQKLDLEIQEMFDKFVETGVIDYEEFNLLCYIIGHNLGDYHLPKI